MRDLKKLRSMLTAGQIGRRDFMMGALAMGVSVAAASTMAEKALAATPNKGGTFRQGLTGAGSGDSLDPAQILDSYMINVSFGQLRNCLTEIDQQNKLVGELAESWDASDDASIWTFKLRKGVEFHNGKTLDSTDVVESIQHHLGEDSRSAAKGIIANITDVKADGKETVVFTLSGGSADFPYLLSDYHLSICPAKPEGGMDWESGVGTGGYVLKSFDPGVRTITTRNPNYWKTGYGHFEEIDTIFIADVAARTAALQTGEIDGMQNVDLKTVKLLERQPNVIVFHSTGNQHITLPMFTDTAPFDNNDLRLALKYSIDREEWLRVILKNYGELGNDIPIGPVNQYRATPEEIPQRAYDPDKAKHHLKKAGYDSIDLQLYAANTAFEGAVDAVILYAERARPAGINITVQREPDDGYWSNIWMNKPWVCSYWGGRPTEDWMFSQVYSTGADWNETHFDNERFMKLLVEGRAELDDAKRRDIYVEMQRIVHDEGGAVIPLFMSYVSAVNDKVQLPEQMASNWGFDGEKAAERWWYK
ncbi:MAG: ABC transporter substrate-binding protein [Pseudomonadota bacterium]